MYLYFVYLHILSIAQPLVEYIVLLDTNKLALPRPDNPQYMTFEVSSISSVLSINNISKTPKRKASYARIDKVVRTSETD